MWVFATILYDVMQQLHEAAGLVAALRVATNNNSSWESLGRGLPIIQEGCAVILGESQRGFGGCCRGSVALNGRSGLEVGSEMVQQGNQSTVVYTKALYSAALMQLSACHSHRVQCGMAEQKYPIEHAAHWEPLLKKQGDTRVHCAMSLDMQQTCCSATAFDISNSRNHVLLQ
jgi:hypothetical protein